MTISRERLLSLTRLAVFIAAMWTFAGFFFASQQHAVSQARGEPEDVHARTIETTVSMIIWALLTPPIIFVAERLPLARPHAVRNASALVAIGIAFAVMRGAVDAAVPPAFEQKDLDHDRFVAVMAAGFHIDFLFFLAIVLVTNYGRARRQSEQQLQREVQAEATLMTARLRRLRSELQPHFLFNTLNGIASLARTNGAAAAEAMFKLADLLESAVTTDGNRVSLSDELDFIRRYFDLERLRFGPRLQTRIEVDDPSLLSFSMPPLLLQPLVENAIIHGIRKTERGGIVTVRATRADGGVRFEVRDTGPGCDPSTPFSRAHVGVRNTVSRLDSIYGSGDHLQYRREGSEFVAELRIPVYQS